MDLLLWRWSVGVQWTSLAMITAFFLVLERSHRLVELRSWVAAWAANLVALGITVLYWNSYPTGAAFRGIAAGYMGAKVAFAVLLILGAVQLRGLDSGGVSARLLALPIALFTAGGLLVPTLEGLGLVSNPALGVIFAVGGALLLRSGGGLLWLAVAMLLRAALFLAATGAFVVTTVSAVGHPSEIVTLARSFLSAHSFFDTLAEWVLALTSVLALSDRMSTELRQSNRDLQTAQDDLRRLADRDPLTSLQSRRALPDIVDGVPPEGALLLFFDVDGLRVLNDRHGHQVGDECLRRFANALRDCFRPGDALVRYAGDEFLVVAAGLAAREAEERVERLRSCLRAGPDGAPEVRFSVGKAWFEAGGRFEEALQAADRSMDAAKATRPL